MIKKNCAVCGACFLVLNVAYPMDNKFLETLPNGGRFGTLFDRSLDAVVKTIDKYYKYHLTAKNVCKRYDQLYDDCFSKMPLEVVEKVKNHYCLKYGCMQLPLDLTTSALDDNKILAISSSGNHCVLSGTGSIDLLDVETMQYSTLQTVQSESKTGMSIAISPTHRLIAIGMFNGVVKFLDLLDKISYQTKEAHTQHVTSLAFCPNGKLVASSSYDSTINLWDPFTAQSYGNLLKWHTMPVKGVCFCSNDRLASCSNDGSVCIGTICCKEPLVRLTRHRGNVTALCYCPCSNLLISGSEDETICRFSATTGEQVGPSLYQKAKVYAMNISSDGKFLAVGLSDNSIKLWNIEKGSLLKTLKMESQEHDLMWYSGTLGTEAVMFAKDSLVSAYNHVRVWRYDNFEKLWLKYAVARSLRKGDKKGLKCLHALLGKDYTNPCSMPRLFTTLGERFMTLIWSYIAKKLIKG